MNNPKVVQFPSVSREPVNEASGKCLPQVDSLCAIQKGLSAHSPIAVEIVKIFELASKKAKESGRVLPALNPETWAAAA